MASEDKMKGTIMDGRIIDKIEPGVIIVGAEKKAYDLFCASIQPYHLSDENLVKEEAHAYIFENKPLQKALRHEDLINQCKEEFGLLTSSKKGKDHA